MAQVRCDSCGKMIDQQRAVQMENHTYCQECARKLGGGGKTTRG